SLGLSRGVFFPRESFGRDTLVTGDPMPVPADDIAPDRLNAKPVRDFVAAFPVSDKSKAELVALFEQTADPPAGKTLEEKQQLLEQTSYRDYLVKVLGCSEEVANCFQGRPHDNFALGCDILAAADARQSGFPGFDGLGLPKTANADMDEPYIYHFPD